MVTSERRTLDDQWHGPAQSGNDEPAFRDATRSDGTPATAGSGAPAAAAQAQQAAGQVADQARQTAGQIAGQARQQAQSQLATQKASAAQALSSAAQALTQVGQQLRQNQQEPLARGADMAAGQVDRIAGYLQSRTVNDLVGDVENIARRQPALFLAGAFVLGVAGARFLKSGSSTRTPSARSNTWQSAQPWPRTSANPSWDVTNTRSSGDVGAPFGTYDPGSAGVEVRELPQ